MALEIFSTSTATDWAAVLVGSLIGYVILKYTYRLTFHPLTSFPGPKLAAMTSLYQLYYEVYRDGQFLNKLQELHIVYGPVVRLGPNFVHFAKSEAYHEIYRTGPALLKDPHLYDTFHQNDSSFTAIDPAKHKARRELMNPFFSSKAVTQLTPKVIQGKVDLLIDRLLSIARDPATKKSPVNLRYTFRGFALDIITTYCFGWSIGCLSYPSLETNKSPTAKLDFAHPVLVGVSQHISFLWLLKWFPPFRFMLNNMPKFIVRRLGESTKASAELVWEMETTIAESMAAVKDGNEGKLKDVDHDLIFHRLLTFGHDGVLNNRTGKPEEPLDMASIVGESMGMIEAGSETVGGSLYSGLFLAFSNPTIVKSLRQEIDAAWKEDGGNMSLRSFEKLPYLTAFIKETLRYVPNVETPLPRVTQMPMTIAGHFVPEQTVVATSTLYVHRDTKLFPEPDRFMPERWLTAEAKETRLDQWICAFSKGSRICLGEKLAWAELFVTFGHLFRNIDLEIHDTTLADITEYKDIYVPIYTGKDFHAIIKERKF